MLEHNEDIVRASENNNLDQEKETKEELLLETSDTLFDMLIESDFLESLPFIKIGYATLKLAKSIQNKRFYRKINILLDEIRNRRAAKEQIKDFQEKIKSSQEYREQVLGYILIRIERLDEEDKAVILGRLLISFVLGYIDWKTFRDLCAILERAHMIALECLAKQDIATIGLAHIDHKNKQSTTGVTSSMQEAILIEASGLGFRPQLPYDHDKNAILTPLGRDMMIFGIHLDEERDLNLGEFSKTE
jgi:hypothetical protein